MKPKIVLAVLGTLTLAAVVGVVALNRNAAPRQAPRAGLQTFQVNGVIRNLDAPNQTVRVTHEEIPNYMPAMTMPLTVKDVALLQGLAAGDNVRFELTVTEDDSWISHLEKRPATETVPGAEPIPAASAQDREAERIQIGEAVPDFQLTDQNGRPIRLKDYRGKAVLITFIYTRCPIPNFCPLMSKNFASLEKRLSQEFPGKFQLISVTMDWQFDTPPVLKEYASRYAANEADWTFATGNAEQISAVAGLMGLFYEWEGGLISHDLRTALIGPEGRLVHVWKSNVWTPYEVQRMVKETLSGGKDYAATR
jgi:protein SCO1/2